MKAIVIILILAIIACGRSKVKNRTDSTNAQRNKTSIFSKSDLKNLLDLASTSFSKNILPSTFLIVGDFAAVNSELLISVDGDENKAIIKLKTPNDSVYLVLDLTEVRI